MSDKVSLSERMHDMLFYRPEAPFRAKGFSAWWSHIPDKAITCMYTRVTTESPNFSMQRHCMVWNLCHKCRESALGPTPCMKRLLRQIGLSAAERSYIASVAPARHPGPVTRHGHSRGSTETPGVTGIGICKGGWSFGPSVALLCMKTVIDPLTADG